MSPEMTNDEIIKEFWEDKNKTYDFIGEMCNPKLSGDAVRKRGRDKLGLPPRKMNSQNKKLSVEEEVKRDIVVGNLSKERLQATKKYKLVARELEETKLLLDAFKVIGSSNTYSIKCEKESTINEATALAVLSDIHFAETVKSDNVNGKNEYSTVIARARIEKFFISLVKLIKIFKKESEINNLILALLGDLINGQLREEAMENNSMQPMEEMLAVKEILVAGIKYLLANTDVNITIPCHSGNHARTTNKIHISTEAGNSIEYVLYHSLAYDFKDNKRVKFIIPTSYHSFIDVGGLTIRFHHGHAMRYAGGVGGIYISVNKAISQWNKVQRADLDVFGHFHQVRDGGNFVCNGSVIGWNEYANFLKCDYEKPQQVFCLIDHKRKQKTVTAPIFLD